MVPASGILLAYLAGTVTSFESHVVDAFHEIGTRDIVGFDSSCFCQGTRQWRPILRLHAVCRVDIQALHCAAHGLPALCCSSTSFAKVVMAGSQFSGNYRYA